jgi:hypothetical protein
MITAPTTVSAPRAPRRLATSTRFALLDLARNPVAAVLLLVIPLILFGLILLTTGDRDIPFQLSTTGDAVLTGTERKISLLYIGLTSISGISAFLGFLLVLRPVAADRRLVFEGYRPAELLVAKLTAMLAVALAVAAYVSALLPLFSTPGRAGGVFLGFLLASLIYATIGLGLGALVRREIDGMLVILMLVNIDAGWLQNPVFYAHAHQQQLIRMLPAHQPGQLVMASAFTDADLTAPFLLSAGYLAALGLLAALIYHARIRVAR